MLRSILIDDRPDELNALATDLRNVCAGEVQIIAMCTSATEGLKAIRNLNPDLVFLDVQMPEMDGFEVLRQVGTISFNIIFTSGFDEYAVRAFRVSAIDFLKKPVREDELAEAVRKVIRNRNVIPLDHIKALFENRKEIRKIALLTGRGYLFFKATELAYFEADGNYCYAYTVAGEKIHSNYSLLELEHILPREMFFRIHVKYFVNRDSIKRFLPKKEEGILVVEDGRELPVAKRRINEFKKWLL